MRTLHQQAAAYSRDSLVASSAKHAAHRQPSPDASPEKSMSDRPDQSIWKVLPLALAAGFGAQFLVLLLCLLTGLVSSLAPALLLSSLGGLTVFCLCLAFSKGGR